MISPSPSLPSRIVTRIPGKLFIAGEYAILKPGQSAILTAVNQYLSCHIHKQTQEFLELTTDIAHLNLLRFPNKQIFDNTHEQTHPDWLPALCAIKVAYHWLEEHDYTIRPMAINLQSELQATHGKKYGLGSSGAVIVAIVLAILKFHNYPINSHTLLFKLSVIASIQSGSNGSMADIATISHGEWIYYQNFDHAWLHQKLTTSNLKSIVNSEWPLLVIRSLPIARDWLIMIGWTGKPASTQSLVKQLNTQTASQPQAYLEFQEQVAVHVQQIYQAISNKDFDNFTYHIHANHKALRRLGQHYDLPIETPLLHALVTACQQLNWPAKLSGAGGGDCGICFMSQSDYTSTQEIEQAWQSHGILPLPFTTAPKIHLST